MAPYDMTNRKLALGTHRDGKIQFSISLPPATFEQVWNEANLRGWSLTRMVAHLVEASIDGIE